ncbi:hypothetical protein OH76DRAFT_133603 [Lentinus brumalis]|uniref:Uncharacterized protein n=1 Tax=Lentinus brumalis TaxID=2498619 RepID=A0A371DK41_9APHY|nr:hypothetical protein OH76DRAFT_133603 [Polyporus brumalis]
MTRRRPSSCPPVAGDGRHCLVYCDKRLRNGLFFSRLRSHSCVRDPHCDLGWSVVVCMIGNAAGPKSDDYGVIGEEAANKLSRRLSIAASVDSSCVGCLGYFTICISTRATDGNWYMYSTFVTRSGHTQQKRSVRNIPDSNILHQFGRQAIPQAADLLPLHQRRPRWLVSSLSGQHSDGERRQKERESFLPLEDADYRAANRAESLGTGTIRHLRYLKWVVLPPTRVSLRFQHLLSPLNPKFLKQGAVAQIRRLLHLECGEQISGPVICGDVEAEQTGKALRSARRPTAYPPMVSASGGALRSVRAKTARECSKRSRIWQTSWKNGFEDGPSPELRIRSNCEPCR